MELNGALTFDVNLSILFTELPLLRRPAAVAEVGLHAVELWWPFTTPVPADQERRRLLDALGEAECQLIALNFDAGDMAAGDRGLLSLREHSTRFRDNVEAAVDLAEQAGCRLLNALYGNRDHTTLPRDQDEVALDNVLRAARAARRIGATVLVEALNSYENPRYPLVSSASALSFVDRARTEGADNVALLADLYHLSRMGESPEAVLTTAGDRLAHVQVADVPGRNEPGSGELGIVGLFGPVERSGFSGPVGLEYRPSAGSRASFGWLETYRNAASSVLES